MNYPKPSPATLRKEYIQKNYEELYEYLINLPEDLEWKQRTYWFYHGITEHPTCPICGSKLKFHCTGYPKYCSISCSRKDSDVINKVKKTNLERYGVDNPAKSSSIQKKMNDTCIKKYGDNYRKIFFKKAQKTIDEKRKTNPNFDIEIQQKIKQTKLERYGDENYNNCEKTITTNLKKYGDRWFPLSQSGRISISNGHKNRTLKNKEFVIAYDKDGNWICKCPHPNTCNQCLEKTYVINQLNYFDRLKDGTELCTKLLPVGKHLKNTTIEQFIKKILDDNNIEYFENNRSIIFPKELDIYIPSKNIAIECNGIYFHSTHKKNNLYHVIKNESCTDKNINLITIWEDQIKRIPDIVKSVILSKLGIYDRREYARNCIIKEIDAKTCNQFLDSNHIQGKTTSQIKLGAFIKDELVGVMTFIKSRACQGSKNINEGEWELNRFCTKLNTQVIGLVSKMLNYFIDSYNPTTIISFSHNDISQGNVYKKLGFKKEGCVRNSYYYIDKNYKRYHRSNFTRSAIVKRWPEYNIDDKSWTEKNVMCEKGFYCIYDCGVQKWKLVL